MNDGTKRALISAAAAGATWLALYRATRDGKPLGWMDMYRVSADYPAELTKYKGKTPLPKTVKMNPKKPGEYPKVRNMIGSGRKTTEGKPWTKYGSPLLTSTVKLRAPSWSLRAGSSCPIITFNLVDALNDLKKTNPSDMTDSEVVEYLKEKVPDKCWACYAKGGNYRNIETKQSQTRRFTWFENTPEDRVVDTLVDAISVAGKETCDHRTKKCTYEADVTPEHFRLFDSGDFHNARAARIWRKVAERMPQVKFWAPTTAWAANCNDEGNQTERDNIMKELRKMAKLPNTTIKLSATQINQPAPIFKVGNRKFPGSTVAELPHKKKKGVVTWETSSADGNVVIPEGTRYHENADDKPPMYVNIRGKKHYVCPGDCTICRYCWKRPKEGKEATPVVYLRHGDRPSAKGLIELVRRTTEEPKHKEVAQALKRDIAPQLINNSRNGPDRR